MQRWPPVDCWGGQTDRQPDWEIPVTYVCLSVSNTDGCWPSLHCSGHAIPACSRLSLTGDKTPGTWQGQPTDTGRHHGLLLSARQRERVGSEGQRERELSVSALPKGTYSVRVQWDEEAETLIKHLQWIILSNLKYSWNTIIQFVTYILLGLQLRVCYCGYFTV